MLQSTILCINLGYHKHIMPGKCDFEIGLEPPPLERDTKEVKMVSLTNLGVILFYMSQVENASRNYREMFYTFT